MPLEVGDAAYLWDMLDAARKIQDFVAGKTFRDYAADEMLRSAVERKVEVLGEAARRVSETFRRAHPEIPWRPIMAQRHVLAHEYGEVKQENLWRVATRRIPELIVALDPLVPPAPEAADH